MHYFTVDCQHPVCGTVRIPSLNYHWDIYEILHWKHELIINHFKYSLISISISSVHPISCLTNQPGKYFTKSDPLLQFKSK